MLRACLHGGWCLPHPPPLRGHVATLLPQSARRQIAPSALPVASSNGVDSCDENIGDYCSIGIDGRPEKLSLGEKENMFLHDVSARALGSRPLLSDAEFDLIEEELTWQGSELINLTQSEQQLLSNFRAGLPIDDDLEAKATQLRREGSLLAVLGPRCSLANQEVLADAIVDSKYRERLQFTATLGILGGLLAADTFAGAHLQKLFGGSVLSTVLAAGLLFPLARLASGLVVATAETGDRVIGTCPVCGSDEVVFSVPKGLESVSVVSSCPSCSSKLTMNNQTLQIGLGSQ